MTREEIKAYLENYDENRMRASLRVMQGMDDDPFVIQSKRLSLCIDCLPDYLKEVIKALEYLEFCMKDLEAIYDKND